MVAPTQTGSRFAWKILKRKRAGVELGQHELKCKGCRRIIMRVKERNVEIKCKCNTVNRFVFPKEDNLAVSAAQ